MNVLLVEDSTTFKKIAVRSVILFFVTVIFLGDGLYSSSSVNAIKADVNTSYEQQHKNTQNYMASIEQTAQKLWTISLQNRYGQNVCFNKIKNGVIHTKLLKYIGGKPLKINIIEVNPLLNPDIKIIPAMAGDKLAKKSNILNISKQYNSFAAVNGSYFKPKTGVPLGILMIDKQLLTGPLYNRAAFAITDDGFKMDRVSLNANLYYMNKQLKVDNINQPRTLCTDVLIYTEIWGELSPATPKYGIQVSISNGEIIKKSNSSVEIPKNGFVIIGPKSKIEEFINNKNYDKKSFKNTNYEKIILDIKTKPQWENVNHIIGGGPFLVKEGNIYVDYIEEKFKPIAGRNPRTAIGFTKEGYFIMVTIDGREEKSVGAGLYELAKIMKSFGCEYAMNLDGGSSSTMQINGKIVNNPSTKGAIAVSNALALTVSQEKITYNDN